MSELRGKTAVVCGGTGTIGRALALKLVAAGARTIAVARDKAKLAVLAAESAAAGSEILCLSRDISRVREIRELTETMRDLGGGIDILCHCAGESLVSPVDELEPAGWDRLWNVNIGSVVLLTRYLTPLINSPGVILNVGSSAGIRPIKGYTAYTTTKAAIIHFTQATALELADKNIRVNCVCPGVIPSGIHQEPEVGELEFYYELMRDATPLGRLGKPEDVVEAIYFLVSNRALWITGAVLCVDGGISLI